MKEDTTQKPVIAFPEKYFTQIYPFIKKVGYVPVIGDITLEMKRSDFAVYPTWEDLSSEEDRVNLEYLDSIYLRDVEVYRVYSVSSGK